MEALAACLFLLNGLILIQIGILGEYIGRIYDENKSRAGRCGKKAW
ncbi:hypothetical membrane protein [Pelotomaculum thermopropionicum SI]|uniref:Hypothetical membrane protein n=1 Tax=Pelotomaculum thermopropionicum (strain DSM 13744 / JCM 10971 / SI) TaxID=370438 RepID=A5D6A3_PELTS|nr:hypothetical membrane protein [Pelotomaculum thermopropionicum SI]